MREVLPAIAFSLDDIRDNELAEANRFFSRGKFVESLAGFRTIIQKLLLVVAKDESEATDVSHSSRPFLHVHHMAYVVEEANAQIKEMVVLCREYIIGLTMETERRRLVAESPESNTIRNLELAAYFTHCKLASSHVQLALRSAMGVYSKAGNHATAAVFARRLIDSNPSAPTVITQVSPIDRWFFIDGWSTLASTVTRHVKC